MNKINKKYTKDFLPWKGITISDNCFIGCHSIILPGVTIGSNSIVGAGSVVTKDIGPNQVWAGNPARFIESIDDLALKFERYSQSEQYQIIKDAHLDTIKAILKSQTDLS